MYRLVETRDFQADEVSGEAKSESDRNLDKHGEFTSTSNDQLASVRSNLAAVVSSSLGNESPTHQKPMESQNSNASVSVLPGPGLLL